MAPFVPASSIAAVLAISFPLFTGAAAAQSKTPPVLDVPPGETGRRITEQGLLANYFPARQKGPAVLALTGSVGGLTMTDTSIALQTEGFSVLLLSSFADLGRTRTPSWFRSSISPPRWLGCSGSPRWSPPG